MIIARVFPRRTKATPDDALALTSAPGLFAPEVDAVHVSVTFSWDIARAEWLAREWERVAPVTIGGPATGMAGSDFTPGQYLKPGYVITSRWLPQPLLVLFGLEARRRNRAGVADYGRLERARR